MGLAERVAALQYDRRLLFPLLAVLAVFLAVVPYVPGSSAHDIQVLHTGLVFVMLGVSWNLIAGYAGQISLGHAAFFGIGAYVSGWLVSPGKIPGWLGSPLASLPMTPLLAVVLGALAAGVVALLIGPAMFRLRGHYFAIGTLALAAIIQLFMNNAQEFSGGASGFFVTAGKDLSLPGGATMSFSVLQYYYAVVAAVLMILVGYYVYHAKLGLGMRAIDGDEAAADSLGVDPFRYKMYAFVLSSFLAGVAGALVAQYTLYLNPSSTLSVTWTIDALVIVILGGMGSVFGPLFGAGIFLVIDTYLSTIVGGLSTSVEGVLIILFVLFLPNGLYGYIEARLRS